MTETDSVWIFHGEGARFASGAFTTKEKAVGWIEKGGFRGILTRYPLDQGCYDWAVDQGLFTPKKPHHFSTPFIQNFTTAAQDHEHFPNDGEPMPMETSTTAGPVAPKVYWPDAELECLEIDYDEIRISLTQSPNLSPTVVCAGYIGYEVIGFWDECIVEQAFFLEEHDLIGRSLKSIKSRHGGELYPTGCPARNKQTWRVLSIRFIDGHILNVAAADFRVVD